MANEGYQKVPQAGPPIHAVQSERRAGARRRVLKPVQVMSMDRRSTSVIDCTLRNLSVCGAQLSGTASCISRLPAQFYLIIPGQLRMIRSKVVWKSYDAAGIMFHSHAGRLASELTASIDHAAKEPARRAPKAGGKKAAVRTRKAANRAAKRAPRTSGAGAMARPMQNSPDQSPDDMRRAFSLPAIVHRISGLLARRPRS
jgi:hypothetical protein